MYCRAMEPLSMDLHIVKFVSQMHSTTSLPKDLDVAFHALLKLHKLAVLLEMCRTTLTSLGITTDQLQWPDFTPPAHCRWDISPMHKSPIWTGFDPLDVPCSLCI